MYLVRVTMILVYILLAALSRHFIYILWVVVVGDVEMWITYTKTQYIVLEFFKDTIYCIMSDIIYVEKMWISF